MSKIYISLLSVETTVVSIPMQLPKIELCLLSLVPSNTIWIYLCKSFKMSHNRHFAGQMQVQQNQSHSGNTRADIFLLPPCKCTVKEHISLFLTVSAYLLSKRWNRKYYKKLRFRTSQGLNHPAISSKKLGGQILCIRFPTLCPNAAILSATIFCSQYMRRISKIQSKDCIY